MGHKYTNEFKQEAAKLVTEHGYSQAEAGRSLGVGDKNIHRWVKESQVVKKPKASKDTLTTEQEELKQLKKEVTQLRLEREILKKAVAFFAREQT